MRASSRRGPPCGRPRHLPGRRSGPRARIRRRSGRAGRPEGSAASAVRSVFPFRGAREAGHPDQGVGHHVVRQPGRQPLAVRLGRVVLQDVAGEAGCASPRSVHGPRDGLRMPSSRAGSPDLLQLDPVARAPGPGSRAGRGTQIVPSASRRLSRPCGTCGLGAARRRTGRTGSVPAVRSGRPEVAAGENAVAADVQLLATGGGNGPARTVEDVERPYWRSGRPGRCGRPG